MSETARLKQSETIYKYKIGQLEATVIELQDLITELEIALKDCQEQRNSEDIIDVEIIE